MILEGQLKCNRKWRVYKSNLIARSCSVRLSVRKQRGILLRYMYIICACMVTLSEALIRPANCFKSVITIMYVVFCASVCSNILWLVGLCCEPGLPIWGLPHTLQCEVSNRLLHWSKLMTFSAVQCALDCAVVALLQTALCVLLTSTMT